ncbi:hypothetical protein [Pseudonocardia sp.]|uniref:hypothetical protein n=1 Tax=Pseudonocardia sp. TaxID=60912 RepID=UPI003D127F3A
MPIVLAAAVAGCAAAPTPAPTAVRVESPAPSREAFCDAVRANVEAVKPLNALNAKGPAPHPAADVAAAVAPLRLSYRAVLDAAPAELRPDAERAFELAQMQLDIYERTSGDATAVSTDPDYAARAQESAPALQRVQDFTRTRCS